jgi:hypothetical protein
MRGTVLYGSREIRFVPRSRRESEPIDSYH